MAAESNVSLDSVATFKLATLEEVEAIGAELTRLFGLGEEQRVDVGPVPGPARGLEEDHAAPEEGILGRLLRRQIVAQRAAGHQGCHGRRPRRDTAVTAPEYT